VAPQQQGFIGQPSTFQQQPATLTTQQQGAFRANEILFLFKIDGKHIHHCESVIPAPGFIQPASFAQPGLLQQPLLNQPL
jgi:hypothetical protein